MDKEKETRARGADHRSNEEWDAIHKETSLSEKIKCFWCNKRYNDLVEHTKKEHPKLDPRSYDFKKEISLSEEIERIANHGDNCRCPVKMNKYAKDQILTVIRKVVLRLKEDMCFVMVRSKGFCNTCRNCVKINKRFGDKLI